MSRFNTKTITRTPVRNTAGGKAFAMDAQTELIHAVLTTFLDDKYYESGADRMSRLQTLIGKCDPQFVARLAVIARREFHLRSVSHLLLGELSKNVRGEGIVKTAIVAATERPDDLTELAAYVGLPMPKQVKRGIRNALLKFDRYALSKYRGEGHEFSLVDLFNMTHPKAQHATKEQRDAWKDLINGDLKTEGKTWESKLSATEGDEEAKTDAWEGLIAKGKLGYMALLRNLNNLIKSGVSDKTIKLAVKQLTDPAQIKKSKQLPFRYYTAYEQVQGNRLLTDAISEAMDIAVDNAPKLEGKTLIAVDVSGSMSGDPLTKAGIMAATLAKANKDADITLIDTSKHAFNVSSRLPVVDIVEKMRRYGGGGTEMSLAFDTNVVYDRIIILSDNESWAESWRGDSVQQAFNRYKSRTGATPTVFAIDIQGYGTKDITGGDVFHLAGFSDRLLDFITLVEKGKGLADYVSKYELPEIVHKPKRARVLKVKAKVKRVITPKKKSKKRSR